MLNNAGFNDGGLNDGFKDKSLNNFESYNVSERMKKLYDKLDEDSKLQKARRFIDIACGDKPKDRYDLDVSKLPKIIENNCFEIGQPLSNEQLAEINDTLDFAFNIDELGKTLDFMDKANDFKNVGVNEPLVDPSFGDDDYSL